MGPAFSFCRGGKTKKTGRPEERLEENEQETWILKA
jgi:hypothetical protein